MAITQTYVDAVLNTSVNPNRKYSVTEVAENIIMLEDITDYSVTGSEFAAEDANQLAEGYARLDTDTSTTDGNLISALNTLTWGDVIEANSILNTKSLFNYIVSTEIKQQHLQSFINATITYNNQTTTGLPANTWTPLTLSNVIEMGNDFTVSNNNITIGAGVQKVSLSAILRFGTTTSSNSSGMYQIRINDNTVAEGRVPLVAGSGACAPIAGIVCEVNEGDVISLVGQSTSAASLARVFAFSQITIKTLDWQFT